MTTSKYNVKRVSEPIKTFGKVAAEEAKESLTQLIKRAGGDWKTEGRSLQRSADLY